MSAPFAEYTLTARPDWLEVSLPRGSAIVLTPGETIVVSRRSSGTIFVQSDPRLFALGWGGTQNHSISLEKNDWWLQHSGHHAPIWLNDEQMRGRHRLDSGDRVAPALGLVFTFTLRPDLDPLAAALASERFDPLSDVRVLADWVMERTGRDAAWAALAARHLMR